MHLLIGFVFFFLFSFNTKTHTKNPTNLRVKNTIITQECTLISKERRHALRITQGPRSRASIAACHSSFQTPHSSLGATYNFLCDSVPDLSSSGGGFSDSPTITMLTNHSLSSSTSAPRKIPIKNGSYHTNSATNNNNNNNNNNFLMNGYGTPLRMQNHNKKSVTSGGQIDYDNDDNVVQLRRRNAHMNKITYENNANDKQNNDWMYRRPTAPNDIRHSCEYFVFVFFFHTRDFGSVFDSHSIYTLKDR